MSLKGRRFGVSGMHGARDFLGVLGVLGVLGAPGAPGVRDSFLVRMDARIRLLLALGLLALFISLQGFASLGLALALSVLLLVSARISLSQALSRLAPANLFFLFLFVALSLTYPARELGAWHYFSLDGLQLAAIIALKGNAMLLALLSLVASSPVPVLANALQQLRTPQKLVLLLTYTYRQVFIIAEEMARMRQAAAARCFRPRMGLHAYKTFGYFLAQSLMRSLDRGQRVHDAMLMRGFTGRYHLLCKSDHITPLEIVFALFVFTLGLGLVVLDRGVLC